MCCQQECAICLEPLTPEHDTNFMVKKHHIIGRRNSNFGFVQLACGHTFHMKCLKDLYFTKNEDFFLDPVENPLFAEHTDKCPMCRENISVKSGKYHHIINSMWAERKMDLLYDYLEAMGVSEDEYFNEGEYEFESDDDYDEFESDGEDYDEFESDGGDYGEFESDGGDYGEFESDGGEYQYQFLDESLWGQLNTTLGHYMTEYS